MVNASIAFHLLITNLLVNLSSTLIIIILNVFLILLTCVTKLFVLFYPLYSYFIRILSYNVTF